MSQVDRIASFLAQGLPASAISTIVGVSPARISQIQKEDGFAELLQGKQLEFKEKDAEELSLAGKYLEAEHSLLKQVIELAPMAEMRDVVGALRVVSDRQNNARKIANPILQGSVTLNQVVQLSLPAHATPELTLSPIKEVIAIGQRNLAPLSSEGVVSLFRDLGQTKEPVIMEHLSKGIFTNEPLTSLTETTSRSSEIVSFNQELISGQKLAASAQKFLDSLHPAPFASSF